MSKTFKEYEKENTLICPRCNLKIKILNPIPMSIFDDIHEDMYISHEDEYLERKALQHRIDKAIEYIERNCLEFNVKYACQGLNSDKVDDLLDILRGEDNVKG